MNGTTSFAREEAVAAARLLEGQAKTIAIAMRWLRSQFLVPVFGAPITFDAPIKFDATIGASARPGYTRGSRRSTFRPI
jgi:hypothetical protein